MPAGVVEPSMTIARHRPPVGRAVVDLDAVRKQKAPTSLLDPMNYLMGRLPVTATGVLTTSNGVGRFELESASVGSVPIPKILLQEIVSYYSRTPEKPAGISLDDPFRAAGAHPRDPGRARSSHNRAMTTRDAGPTDPLATPLQFLKGVGPRRAADLEHAGLLTRRRSPVPLSAPLRRSQPPPADRVAEAGPDRRRSPAASSAAACARRAVPASRSSRRRSTTAADRSARSWLNQPFLRDVFTRGQHVVLYGAVEMRGIGGLQLTNPQYEILDDEDGETIHTGRIVPVYEKTGTRHAEDAAAARVRRAAAAAGRSAGSAARRRSRCGSDCRRATRRCSRRTFRRRTRSVDALNSLRDAGAAAADLRGGVSVPDGRARAAAGRGGGAEAAADPRRRSHSRLGARACCRSG